MKLKVAIIGGGPSALILASHLNAEKFDVTIYERNAALGRKFLVAGDGGFNLTHSEEDSAFIGRFTPTELFQRLIPVFNNDALRNWLKQIGIETYVGSSKRVFPTKGIKPIDVLNAILNELKNRKVKIVSGFDWTGFEKSPDADVTVFALGGGSWKVTGSDGGWTKAFIEKGIEIKPFYPSNCAYEVKWSDEFLKSSEGKSLKNISIACKSKSKKGEVVITKFGLEGGAIYALSPEIRKQLKYQKTAEIFIDLKPHLSTEQIRDKFSSRGNRSIKKLLVDRLSLDDTQIDLLKTLVSKEEFMDLETLAKKIKSLPITLTAPAPIDDAISTVGGVPLTEIDSNFQLKKLPGTYCIGEMLDWDAPTGGYLLQGCFSMGYFLAQHLNKTKLS